MDRGASVRSLVELATAVLATLGNLDGGEMGGSRFKNYEPVHDLSGNIARTTNQWNKNKKRTADSRL